MYIQEITKELNMTKKAIQIYEDKGLIHPQKNELGYRVYSDKERQTLLKIKQLRRFNFSIQEIKEVIINKNYDLFDSKKEALQKQIYELETSVQFIDDIKECIMKDEDITLLANDLEDIFKLKELTPAKNLSLDFDKVILFLVIICFFFGLKSGNNVLFEVISCICFGLILLIYYSSTVRLFIFKIINKLKRID